MASTDVSYTNRDVTITGNIATLDDVWTALQSQANVPMLRNSNGVSTFNILRIDRLINTGKLDIDLDDDQFLTIYVGGNTVKLNDRVRINTNGVFKFHGKKLISGGETIYLRERANLIFTTLSNTSYGSGDSPLTNNASIEKGLDWKGITVQYAAPVQLGNYKTLEGVEFLPIDRNDGTGIADSLLPQLRLNGSGTEIKDCIIHGDIHVFVPPTNGFPNLTLQSIHTTNGGHQARLWFPSPISGGSSNNDPIEFLGTVGKGNYGIVMSGSSDLSIRNVTNGNDFNIQEAFNVQSGFRQFQDIQFIGKDLDNNIITQGMVCEVDVDDGKRPESLWKNTTGNTYVKYADGLTADIHNAKSFMVNGKTDVFSILTRILWKNNSLYNNYRSGISEGTKNSTRLNPDNSLDYGIHVYGKLIRVVNQVMKAPSPAFPIVVEVVLSDNLKITRLLSDVSTLDKIETFDDLLDYLDYIDSIDRNIAYLNGGYTTKPYTIDGSTLEIPFNVNLVNTTNTTPISYDSATDTLTIHCGGNLLSTGTEITNLIIAKNLTKNTIVIQGHYEYVDQLGTPIATLHFKPQVADENLTYLIRIELGGLILVNEIFTGSTSKYYEIAKRYNIIQRHIHGSLVDDINTTFNVSDLPLDDFPTLKYEIEDFVPSWLVEFDDGIRKVTNTLTTISLVSDSSNSWNNNGMGVVPGQVYWAIHHSIQEYNKTYGTVLKDEDFVDVVGMTLEFKKHVDDLDDLNIGSTNNINRLKFLDSNESFLSLDLGILTETSTKAVALIKNLLSDDVLYLKNGVNVTRVDITNSNLTDGNYSFIFTLTDTWEVRVRRKGFKSVIYTLSTSSRDIDIQFQELQNLSYNNSEPSDWNTYYDIHDDKIRILPAIVGDPNTSEKIQLEFMADLFFTINQENPLGFDANDLLDKEDEGIIYLADGVDIIGKTDGVLFEEKEIQYIEGDSRYILLIPENAPDGQLKFYHKIQSLNRLITGGKTVPIGATIKFRNFDGTEYKDAVTTSLFSVGRDYIPDPDTAGFVVQGFSGTTIAEMTTSNPFNWNSLIGLYVEFGNINQYKVATISNIGLNHETANLTFVDSSNTTVNISNILTITTKYRFYYYDGLKVNVNPPLSSTNNYRDKNISWVDKISGVLFPPRIMTYNIWKKDGSRVSGEIPSGNDSQSISFESKKSLNFEGFTEADRENLNQVEGVVRDQSLTLIDVDGNVDSNKVVLDKLQFNSQNKLITEEADLSQLTTGISGVQDVVDDTKTLVNDTKTLVNDTKTLVNDTKTIISSDSSKISDIDNIIKKLTFDVNDGLITNPNLESILDELVKSEFLIDTGNPPNTVFNGQFGNGITGIGIRLDLASDNKLDYLQIPFTNLDNAGTPHSVGTGNIILKVYDNVPDGEYLSNSIFTSEPFDVSGIPTGTNVAHFIIGKSFKIGTYIIMIEADPTVTCHFTEYSGDVNGIDAVRTNSIDPNYISNSSVFKFSLYSENRFIRDTLRAVVDVDSILVNDVVHTVKTTYDKVEGFTFTDGKLNVYNDLSSIIDQLNNIFGFMKTINGNYSYNTTTSIATYINPDNITETYSIKLYKSDTELLGGGFTIGIPITKVQVL